MTADEELSITPMSYKSVRDWHCEADVIVVGFGGAGSCAAIEAHDHGAEVLILEAASTFGGTTALSDCQVYLGGGTRVQKACGIEDSPEDMYRYLMRSQGERADDQKIRAYTDGSVDHFDWLEAQGIEYKDSVFEKRAIFVETDDCLLYTGSEKHHPYASHARPAPRGHDHKHIGNGGGPTFIGPLATQVEQRGIVVQYEVRALKLIIDEQQRVRGLVVRQDMEERCIRAHLGVILCTGGFVMNRAMLEHFAPRLSRGTVPIGNPADTGTGIRMGMGVGAAVINMDQGFAGLPYYSDGAEGLSYGILVNDEGKRFCAEDDYQGVVGSAILEQDAERIYLIASVDDYGRPVFINADIAATGDTVAELEQDLGMPVGSLRDTVQRYNKAAIDGEDREFFKTSDWLKPLTPPLVALDCTPGRGVVIPYFTLGGLKTRSGGEVEREDGSVITGLYAAGRASAGVASRGCGYASGLSVGDATFFGRQAGISAAGATRCDR